MGYGAEDGLIIRKCGTVEYGKMHINGTSEKFMHCVNYAETYL